MDAQDIQDKGLKFKEPAEKIIGCSSGVINQLGSGFLESVCEKALVVTLSDAGLRAQGKNVKSDQVGSKNPQLSVRPDK